jgi:hypothetical protein
MKRLDTLKLAAALVIAASAVRAAEIDPKNGLLEAVPDGQAADANGGTALTEAPSLEIPSRPTRNL